MGWTRECVSFGGGLAQSTPGNISRMHMSGDTLGSTIIVRGALHTYTVKNVLPYLVNRDKSAFRRELSAPRKLTKRYSKRDG